MATDKGLYRKFEVKRIDGSDLPGGKHHGCRYFVLDIDHDCHAAAGLRGYAASCRVENPALADDLLVLADIIATHAPKPEDQPIRRGDVVQLVANCHPKAVGRIWIVQYVTTEQGVTTYGGNSGEDYLFAESADLVRIGRAKFMPDGTPVED